MFATAASLAWTAPCAAQETLTEQDVKQSLANPAFQEALGSCFAAGTGPETLGLVLRVDGSGGVSLSGSRDPLTAAQSVCVGQAATMLSMPPTGSHFEITVTVPVPAIAPPPPPAMVVKKIPPPASAVEAGKPPPEWRIRYSKGKKRLIGGIVSLGVGAELALAGSVLLYWSRTVLCSGYLDYYEKRLCRSWTGLSISMLGLGAVGMVLGAVLVASGRRIKREALESKPVVSLAPHPRGGAVLELTWRF
jgi:hypothetical protein